MTIEMTRPSVHLPTAHLGRADALRDLCGGAVHLPGDEGYDAARTPWNLAVDQRPAAVAVPRSADEVIEVVRAAVRAGLRVAPQSTGHNAGPLAAQDLSDVVVVRTSQLQEVSVDVERKVLRVGGGVEWLPAVEAAAAVGHSVLHGSSPDVGVAGYSLGGGMGWYARQLGLATNSLTAVEVVTADGDLVRADAEHHADLFWAVRGGGGSFGVVTALEMRMFDFASAYAGMLVWDVSRAREVLSTWAAWAPGAPDEVTTSFRILRVPPLPGIPEFLQGRTLVVIDGAVLADDDRAAEVLAELRALGPEIDTFARVPSRELVRLHMDPEGPAPGVAATTMLAGLPETGIETILELAGEGVETPLLMVELRQLGGALARPAENGGALDRLDGAFVAFAGGMAVTAEVGAVTHAAASALMAALEPWSNRCHYLNFAEEPVDVAEAFPAAHWARLQQVRAGYDPAGRFLGNHPVPVGGE